ncbi:hypothetical protein R3D73_000844 [Serratia marcescens]|uniref:hypothetical protein n=1 Tax=Serratia sp. TSA_105.2 TaxID=3415660 RepID=UPI002938816A|nr:hypothetical protein [Serratia marcescens]ELQ9437717.1 hypothetical protein [Serratia marcescens]ELT5558054.1 hypothetical protein [Serratia marcescens]
MSREDMLYQILYSHRLEKMFSTLTGRIDKGLSFLLILLGSSVIAGFGYPVVVGLAIAGISAFKMAFHFEAAAEHSRKQAASYLNLFNTQHLMEDDSDLLGAITKVQDDDHAPWAILTYPAMIATQIELGRTPSSKLSLTEKLFARASGANIRIRSA